MCSQAVSSLDMISDEDTFSELRGGMGDRDFKQLESDQINGTLDLSRKSLRELTLPLLKEYKSIQRLYLEKNYLKELPEEMFGELPFLSWLDVRNNQLSDFPKSVANHEHLEVILLQGNHIQALPLELGLVPKLRGLQISGNPLLFPPHAIIHQGISSILKYLKDECKTCSIYSELVSGDEKLQHADEKTESSTSELKDSYKHSNNIRKNNTGCIAHSNYPPKNNNKDSVTASDTSATEHNTTSDSPSKEPSTCKSSIRVMTNPKGGPLKKRNSAPITARSKTGKYTGRSSTNKTAPNGKHILMRQNAIIQRRKSEEALKSWRDKMRTMKERSSNLKNCVLTKEKLIPYGTDKEYMEMPTREMLHNIPLDPKKQTQRNSSKTNNSANIGEEISLIFKSLQNLKCTKESSLASPRSQQKAVKEKLHKINELNSAIGDLKKKIFTKGP